MRKKRLASKEEVDNLQARVQELEQTNATLAVEIDQTKAEAEELRRLTSSFA